MIELNEDFWIDFYQQYYSTDISKIIENYKKDDHSLIIDYRDLLIKSPEIADRLIESPYKVIYSARKALINYVENIKETTGLTDDEIQKLNVRFNNITRKITIRDIRGTDISKFVSIEGTVKKVTEVRPKIVTAVFRCKLCGSTSEIRQEGNKFVEISYCENCKKNVPFELDHEKSRFVDAQKIRLEEYSERLKGGEQPQTIDVSVDDDLSGKVLPGERIIINGILKSYQKEVRGVKSLFFDIYVVCNSIEVKERDFEEVNISKEDEKKILELSRDPLINEKIVKSIAPSIYGYETIKNALSLQLFSGIEKHLPDGSRIRGDIHILLVGDPGVAKSQLLKYITNLSPKGIYTSGKSVTSAGLTATAVKDDFGDGRWTLEAGALVLADGGIAAVDEMDKMRTEERTSLHEVMEQQTVSVAKAGITATLKARCALLGAANPKLGRFDLYEPIATQINMPPTLISRFDLIFIMTDRPNKERDLAMAEHILRSHYVGEVQKSIFKGEQPVHSSSSSFDHSGYSITHDDEKYDKDLVEDIKAIEPEISPDLLRKYIAYSRDNIFPVLTKEAMDRIKDFYTSMRSGGENNPIPITARQLDALVRLAEASARMRLSDTISIDDVDKILKIVEDSLKQVGVDQETGKLDIDVLMVGTSKSQRDRIWVVKNLIKELMDANDGIASELDLMGRVKDEGLEVEKVERDLSVLKREGEIVEIRPGYFKLV